MGSVHLYRLLGCLRIIERPSKSSRVLSLATIPAMPLANGLGLTIAAGGEQGVTQHDAGL